MKTKVIIIAIIAAAALVITMVLQKPKPQTTQATTVLVIVPQRGSGAALGASSQIGMKLALDDLGPKADKLKLRFQDSETDPNIALRILSARELYANSRIVIAEMSQVTRALVQPAQEQNVLLLATLVGVPNIGKGSTNFIRVNIMSDAIAKPLARFAAKKERTMAILYLNDDYGSANRDLFKETYTDNGGSLVLSEPFQTDTSIVRTLVEKVRASGVSACFVAGYGPVYPELFKKFKELAPAIQLYADIGLANDAVFRAVGDAADGVYLAATAADEFPPTTERGKLLTAKFSAVKPGARPDYVVAFSYDTIVVLTDALEKVPSGDPQAVREYLLKKNFDGLGGKFHFDPNTGDSIYEELPIYKVKAGQIKRTSDE